MITILKIVAATAFYGPFIYITVAAITGHANREDSE
jgi:hypothetical protein